MKGIPVMNQYHETKAGTKLPLRNIRGNLYMDVTWRVVWMREEHPDWQVHTNIVHADDKGALMRAVVINSDGKTIATGHRYQDKSFGAAIEKAESQAIGRALAVAGYGTSHALADFDDGSEDPSTLPDSAVPPPGTRTVVQAEPRPHNSSDPASYLIKFGKYNGKTLQEIGIEQASGYADWLEKSGKPSQQSFDLVAAVREWQRLLDSGASPHALGDAPPDWNEMDVPSWVNEKIPT